MSQVADRFARSGPAERAPSPVNDFGFIDLEIVVVIGREARHLTNGAVDVEHDCALSTNQVMVIVADSVLVARR